MGACETYYEVLRAAQPGFNARSYQCFVQSPFEETENFAKLSNLRAQADRRD